MMLQLYTYMYIQTVNFSLCSMEYISKKHVCMYIYTYMYVEYPYVVT